MTYTFNKQETEAKAPDLAQYLQENPTIAGSSQCQNCPAFDNMNMLPVQGEGKLGILIVLSHATKGDIDMGCYMASQQFTSTAKYLERFGVDINRDCWVTSAVRCNMGGQIPKKPVFDCCRSRLYSTVQQKKPWVVFLMGRNATYGWKGHQFSLPPQVPTNNAFKHDKEYTKWVGNHIPDSEYAFDYNGENVCPVVIPMFNPHDVASGENQNMKRQKVVSVIPSRHMRFIEDGIKLAANIKANPDKHIAKQKNRYNRHSAHVVLNTVGECVNALKELNTKKIIAFDYETTGIKPYNREHAIKMVGIADGTYSYAMPFFNNSPEFMEAYKTLMTNPNVKKIAHNAKFEYVWTKVKLGFDIFPLYWDTMIAAHIIDMRDGVVGLKMQGYLQFGDAGYEKVTKKLLGPIKPTKRKNTNAINWLSYLNPYRRDENRKVWDLLLQYVAEDASLTLALYHRQKQLMAAIDLPHLMQGMSLFMESTITLAEMEMNGFVIDIDALRANKDEIKERMDGLKDDMYTCNEYKLWREKYPDNDINLNSPKQLQEFFFEMLGLQPTKFTKSGLPSTDKEALEDMESEFAKKLLEYKVLDKLRNAFLASYENEMNDDGKIRTLFSLTGVTSYRTSSSSINIQQVSKHSVESRYVLNVLKAHEGMVMLNMDFKSLEVYTAGAHTWMVHDVNNPSTEGTLKFYLDDPSTDMHRDIAAEIYMIDPSEVSKDLRNRTKKFTFGNMYGSGINALARNQWKFMKKEEKEHLAANGVGTYDLFVEHIKKVYWSFWNMRFKEYGVWKSRVWDFYVKYGYFATMTGFLYTAPDLNERNILDYGPQGSGSHVLLQLVNFVNKRMAENGLRSLSCAEVHDSYVLSAYEDDIPKIYEYVVEFMGMLDTLYPFLKGFDFLVECEVSGVNGSWADVKPVAAIDRHGVKYFEKKEAV